MATKTSNSSTTKKKTAAKKTTAKKSAKTSAKKTTRKPKATKTTKKTTKSTVAKKKTTRTPRKSAAQRLAETPAPSTKRSNELSIVEKVFNERNLTTGVEGLTPEQHAEIKNMVLTGAPQQSIAKSAKQQAFLDSFNQIFESTVAEVENLASYVPREDVLDLAYENPEVLVKLRDA